MIGKIVKIGIVGLLAATLIGGSAYVVLRPNEAQAQQENGGRGQSGREYVAEPGSGKRYGAQDTPGQDTGGGNGAATASGNGAGQGRRQGSEQGAGNSKGSSGESRGSEAYAATEWVTVSGEVIARVDDELTIQTADGEMVVHLGPEWYWDEEGVALDAGDKVQVTGFYDGDEFEVARVENTTIDESVTLRDDSGRPMWAGRGRQGR